MNPYEETRAWRLACTTIEGGSRPAGHMKPNLEEFIRALKELRGNMLKIQSCAKVNSHLVHESLPAVQQQLQVVSPMLKRAQVLLQSVNANNPKYTITHLADYMLSVVVQTNPEFLYTETLRHRHTARHTRDYMPPSVEIVKSFISAYPGLFAPLPAMFTLVKMPSLSGLVVYREMHELVLRKNALRERILSEMLLTAEEQTLLARSL